VNSFIKSPIPCHLYCDPEGVLLDFIKRDRPFIRIDIEELSERSLGQFMEFKIIEILFLASLLKVNPFDQPSVESYKETTRKILKK
jgi:glucose-6-phosphate isomerase